MLSTRRMKRTIKKWTLRLVVTVLLIAGLLFVIVLNPILAYANKTIHNNCTIYHNKTIDPLLTSALDQAGMLLATSEFYNSSLKFDICINDGSAYPAIMKTIRGQAFAWGFYDKVVMQGAMNCGDNFVELNGYKWNLIQLLAHEMTHCLQFDKLGLLKSNPVANIPIWKWEGYAEYISRQNTSQKNLIKNIGRLQQANEHSWEIKFEDNTIVPKEYYGYWTLVQYCLDIKKMTYEELLTNAVSEQSIRNEMMKWYEEN